VYFVAYIIAKTGAHGAGCITTMCVNKESMLWHLPSPWVSPENLNDSC